MRPWQRIISQMTDWLTLSEIHHSENICISLNVCIRLYLRRQWGVGMADDGWRPKDPSKATKWSVWVLPLRIFKTIRLPSVLWSFWCGIPGILGVIQFSSDCLLWYLRPCKHSYETMYWWQHGDDDGDGIGGQTWYNSLSASKTVSSCNSLLPQNISATQFCHLANMIWYIQKWKINAKIQRNCAHCKSDNHHWYSLHCILFKEKGELVVRWMKFLPSLFGLGHP